MEVEFNLGKKPSKRPAAVGSSEDSTSDYDPGWSDATDGSTYFRVTPASKKPKKAINAKTNIPVKSTQSIYDAPESWRKFSQSTAGLQGAVDTGEFKVAAPAAAKNNNISNEADVTAPPAPHRAARSHHTCSYRTRIGGPSCAKGVRKNHPDFASA
ncbi:hypothetical protein EVAR_79882_1 [Eumeta japonica]|uniref:Uncharacterized protein n=1 Tax=Eumeta variegata TaxID=151549 RepID=A0A4C1TYY8_EUMVA|nr:hypothetical protein EVAR_79882_1 [Eumeta japonica]